MAYTQPYYRGLLLRDPRFSAENATITPATQQGGPGVDTFADGAGSEGYMSLEATGTSTAGQGYDIECVKPGAGWSEDTAGRYAWRKTADSADPTKYHGHWPQSFISGAYLFKEKTAGQLTFAWPSAISTSDNYVHVSYSWVEESSLGVANAGHIYVATLDPSTETWTHQPVDSQALGDPTLSEGGVNQVGPTALVELPSGRLLLFTSKTGGTGNTSFRVERFISDDRGATWSYGSAAQDTGASSGIQDTDFGWGATESIINFQVVLHNGYLTMIRECRKDNAPSADDNYELDHYVSKDWGVNWTLVERFQMSLAGGLTGLGTTLLDAHDAKLIADDNGTVYLIHRDVGSYPTSGADHQNGRGRYYRKFAPYGKFADDPYADTDNNYLGIPGGTAGTGTHPEPQVGSTSNAAWGNHVVCRDNDGRMAIAVTDGYHSTGGSERNRLGQGVLFRYNFADVRYLADDYRTHLKGWFDCSDNGDADTQWRPFDQTGAPSAGAGRIDDYTTVLNQSCMVAYKDRLLVFCAFSTTGGSAALQSAADGAIICVELGGSSNYDFEHGKSTSASSGDSTARAGFTYLPIDDPLQMVADVAGFTEVFLGGGPAAGEIRLGADGLEINDAGVTNQRAFQHAGNWIHARVRSATVAGTGGGDINSDYIIINGGGVQVRLGSLNAQVFDYTSGTTPPSISDIVVFNDALARDWIVGIEAITVTTSRAFVAYKGINDRLWTRVATVGDGYSGTSLTTPAGTGTCRWGHYHDFNRVSYWQFANIYTGDLGYSGENWGATKVSAAAPYWVDDYHPRRLIGRPFSVHPLYVDDGWKIAAKGSTAFVGDTWTASTRYEYPIEAIHPEVAPTPRVMWQSADDNAEVSIEWTPNSLADTRPLAPTFGIHLSNINFGTAYFEGWNGASWAALANIVTDQDFDGLQYALTGDIIKRNTAAAASWGADRYIKLDELKGSYCFFAGLVDRVHKIAANSEGGFFRTATATPEKDVEIRIEGDPTGLAATGTMTIRQSAVTVLAEASTTVYEKYRLRIPAQATAQGYFQIGVIVIGPVAHFGQDYSWGRVMTIEPNQEINQGRSGDRIVEELGPPRRRVELSWIEGWDGSKTSGNSPTGFNALESSGEAVGVREDPSIVVGMLERSRGAAEPVVYLPRIEYISSPGGSSAPITGRERHMYGRIVSPISRQSVVGDEDENEIHTINAISIEEEI